MKNANDILDHYDKFVSLLRIEKLGRDGLFTLSFYKAEFKKYSPYCCCLDQINPKYLSKADLQIDLHYLGTMAKDILKMWKSTPNLSSLYNGFWGDYNDCWEFAEKVNPALYPRSNPSNWNWVYDNDLDYWPFVIKTIKEYNKSAREKGVDFEKQFNSFMGYKLNNGQYLAMFAYLMQNYRQNELSKEDVLKYIYGKGKIAEYNTMTATILQDYLRKNLSEEDFDYIDDELKENDEYTKSAKKVNSVLWKMSNYSTNNERENLGEDFEYYKFIVDSCKKFRSISWESSRKYYDNKYSMDDIWTFIEVCLQLDETFGKENVRDELLKKYRIYREDNIPFLYDGRADIIMVNREKDIKIVIHSDYEMKTKEIIRGYIFNKLVDKQIISNDKYLKAAMFMAYNFMSNSSPYASFFRVPILSEPFRGGLIGYYHDNMEIYTSGKRVKENISEEEKIFCKQTDKSNEKIPESVQNKFEINERMTKILGNSNNVKQLICPDLVKVVLADDFDQRFRRSLDENNRVRPKMLFKGYRKNTEVKDDRENTAKSDGDLDL